MAGRGDPESLKKILRRAVRSAPLAQREQRRRVERAWAAAAGPELAAHTRVGSFKRGVMRIQADSSALLQELVAFRREEIIEALRRNEEGLIVHEIRFEMGE